MNSCYVAIGSTTSTLFKLFFKNKCRIHPKYFLRIIILLQSGLWSSAFAIPEKRKYKKQIQNSSVPAKPVFIVGHWRTGSTFLHQLLIQDENFISPSVFQVTVPDCYISIEKYYKPFMRKVMGDKRPMDNVRFGPDSPQEDEFALLRMTLNSPLQSVIFPKNKGYFLLENENFICNNSEIKKWEDTLTFFYKKLCLNNNHQLLIKNPFHSMRIKILNKLFPDAVFIHIYRHPHNVIPSTIRMWDIIARQNKLNNNWKKPGIQETAVLLKKMTDKINEDLKSLDSARFTEVRYEDLDTSPVEEIKKIYMHFGLDFSKQTEENIIKFLDEEKDFKKNEHHLSKSDIEVIDEIMRDFMIDKKYNSREL